MKNGRPKCRAVAGILGASGCVLVEGLLSKVARAFFGNVRNTDFSNISFR